MEISPLDPPICLFPSQFILRYHGHAVWSHLCAHPFKKRQAPCRSFMALCLFCLCNQSTFFTEDLFWGMLLHHGHLDLFDQSFSLATKTFKRRRITRPLCTVLWHESECGAWWWYPRHEYLRREPQGRNSWQIYVYLVIVTIVLYDHLECKVNDLFPYRNWSIFPLSLWFSIILSKGRIITMGLWHSQQISASPDAKSLISLCFFHSTFFFCICLFLTLISHPCKTILWLA